MPKIIKDQKRKYFIRLFLLLIIGFSSLHVNAQTQYYKQFIKIWGVLKYETNLKNNDPCYWTNIFIESVTELSKIKDDNEFNQFIKDIIERNCEHPKRSKDVNNKLFERLALSKEISNAIETYFDKAKIDLGPNNRLDFDVDNRCIEDVSTFGEKLLAIARFWNVLFYFHPNREVDYLDALSKTLNLFYTKNEIDQSLVELMRYCQDNHGSIYIPSINSHLLKDFYYPSIKVQYLNNDNYILNSKEYGLENDTLLKINNIPVSQLVDSITIWLPNTDRISKRNASYYLFAGFKNDTSSIQVKGDPNPIKIKYDQNDLSNLYIQTKLTQSLSKNTLYCNLIAIKSKDEEKKIFKEMEEYDTIIFDLRGHVDYYSLYLKKKLNFQGLKMTSVMFDNRILNPIKEHKTVKKKQGEMNKTLYVIVDKYTQSSSEYFAMCLKQNNAELIGENTSGAIGVMSKYKIAKKVSSILTIKKFVFDQDYWAVGIQPTIKVPKISILTPFQIYKYLKNHE